MNSHPAITIGASIVSWAVSTAGAEDAKHPPNIVFILADDLGHGAIGCYGQRQIATPNIDRLASEGIRFTQAYAGSHVCQPSRSVLMTGLHAGHTPVRENDVRQFLLDEDVTLAEVLRDGGYATGGFGKWGLGYEGTSGHPNRQGFDEFFGQYLQVHAHFYYPFWAWHNDEKVDFPENEAGQRGTYIADATHARAIDFIRRSRDRRFFAYLPYILPHVELVVPEDSELPYRGRFPKRAVADPRPGYIGSEDGLTTFAGMVSRLDRYVGEVLALLDELGIAEHTIVVFTSDNGAQGNTWAEVNDYFGSTGGLRGYKGTFYEGGLRVPLLVRWPDRVPPGSVSDHVCSFQDWLPTLCEATGAKAPAITDGISFVPTLVAQGEQVEHLGLYWEYATRDGEIGRAARMGHWKAVQPSPDRPIELYDLQRDPGELTDLAGQHPAIVRTVGAYMDGAHDSPRVVPGPLLRTGVRDYVR
jgi:arylsulfatase A-like enzyme